MKEKSVSTTSEYFKTLRDWKQLPAYRTEPRVDSIVGFALPKIFQHAKALEVATVIPELPLRIGTVIPKHKDAKFANKSYKVDFFVVTTSGKNFLVEFKTDSGSRRKKQDKYLKAAKTVGLKAIISGILKIYSKTTYKDKYQYLLAKLEKVGLVESRGSNYALNVKFDNLNILYIQPHEKDGDENRDIMDFETVANAIKDEFRGDEFMQTAAQTLRSWVND